VPSSRKAATALAATELQRQKVTPSRLRGLKVALRRSGETIDVDALQKALGTQNLRLRDANAAALVREAAWRSQNNEEGAPTKAPLIGIISLVEDLFAPSEKPPPPPTRRGRSTRTRPRRDELEFNSGGRWVAYLML
jgi:hypothetical protein